MDAFKKKEERIDGLINNGGVYNAPRSFSGEGVEIHWATNHLGPFLLTQSLLDILRATPDSRIVFLVNLDYRKGKVDLRDPNFKSRPFSKSEAFNQSQLANMLYMLRLSQEEKTIKVNAAYPGICKTNIKRHMGVDKSVSGNVISKPLLSPLTRSADEGAKTPMLLAIDTQLSVSGQLFSSGKPTDIDPVALDQDSARKLFAVDAYWTGLLTKQQILNTSS